MKILIVGHAGFIGQHLVRKLKAQNHELKGLDLNKGGPELEKLCTGFAGDIMSCQDVLKACASADLIISLAAKHHDFGVTKKEYFDVNETGTRILLDCAAKQEVKKIIFYSSVAVYGTQEKPTTEDTIPAPDNNYGRSKLAAERVVEQWVNVDKGRSVIIIRPVVIYGPNNFANVFNLIDKIYRKKFIFVGKGENVKSVAYVENLVDATVFLIDHLRPGLQIFNYSDEPQMTISELVDVIVKNLPHDIPRIKIPLALAVTAGSVLDVAAKITRINFPITGARMKKFATSTHHKANKIRTLGFKQSIETKEGFRRMIDWYLKSEMYRQSAKTTRVADNLES